MKALIICATLMVATTIYAQSVNSNSSLNLSMPSPAQSYQSDRIRAGELDCSNAIGGGTNVEFGVTGIINKQSDPLAANYGERMKDVGVYARITVPLDGPKERINCNTLYELELIKKRMEIDKLRQELENIKKLQFEK